MSEIAVSARTPAEAMRKDVLIYMLGKENEKLNEGLRAMQADNARQEQEAQALRKALRKAERERDEAARQNRAYREERLEAMKLARAEKEGWRLGRRGRRWVAAGLMLLGALAMAGVILWIFRPMI